MSIPTLKEILHFYKSKRENHLVVVVFHSCMNETDQCCQWTLY